MRRLLLALPVLVAGLLAVLLTSDSAGPRASTDGGALALTDSGRGARRAESEAARRRPDAGPRPRALAIPGGGSVTVERTELRATKAGQQLAVTVRDAGPGTLEATLPERWVRRLTSGLRATKEPTATSDDTATRSARQVRLRVRGDRASLRIADASIPPGTYEVGLRWLSESGGAEDLAEVTVHVRPPSREPRNVTANGVEESETFIAASPADRNRVLAGVNQQVSGMSAYVTSNGGQEWAVRPLPQATQAIDDTNLPNEVCCDPVGAADQLGNLWYGGIAYSALEADFPDQNVVARIPAGTSNYEDDATVLLPKAAGETSVDKPWMAVDNLATSPHRGRLYYVWNSFDAADNLRVVVSICDSHPDVTACDDPAGWSAPVVISGGTGGFIYASVATAPNGDVYATWWDFFNNRIAGTRCAAAAACTTAGAWSAPQTVAQLDATGGDPVPFACPIPAQPGGRAGPSPYVEVDRSTGPESGRVYVSWGDVRAGQGTRRCDWDPTDPPTTAQVPWDTFVASAPGALPGGAGQSSPAVGTRVVRDSEGGAGSDDWFGGLAVDATTGQAYVGFHSTRGDASRRTASFFYRRVGPTGSLGALAELASGRSDYSDNPCCTFGNDFGDYTAMASSQGTPWPVWTDNSTGDGEIYTATPGVTLRSAGGAVTESGGDGDGLIEPGERFAADVRVVNAGTEDAPAFSATVGTAATQLTVDPATLSFGALPHATEADGSADVTGQVKADGACVGDPAFAMDAPGSAITVTVPVVCPTIVPNGPGTTAPTVTPPPPPDLTGPAIVVGSARTVRLTKTGFLSFQVGPFAEDVRGTVSYATKTKKVLKLGSATFTAFKGAKVQVRRKLSKKNLAAIKRLRKARTVLTVTALDDAGNRTVRAITLTVLAPKKVKRRR